MKLDDVVADVAKLSSVLRQGLDKKKVFANEKEHNPDHSSSAVLREGWGTIINLLSKHCPTIEGTWSDGLVKPKDVYKLLGEATAFLKILNPPTTAHPLR